MSDLVLVTGITGFLGGHVALELLRNGYRVRGSMRNLKKAGHVRETLIRAGADVSNLEFCELDLMKDEGWAAAMEGVDYLQHVASPFVIDQPRDESELIRPAVDGTTRALEAALAADVKRIVLTSSSAAIMYGHGKDKSIFTDADWTDVDAPDASPYVRSKTFAERRAWEIMERAGRRTDLVTVNPTAILGPLLDNDPGTSGEIVVRALLGKMPAAPRLNLPTVDVRDVAEAHRLVMEANDAGGQRFPMSHSPIAIIEASRAIGRAVPEFRSRLPRRVLPDWLVRIAAFFNAEARASVGELGRQKRVDSAKTERLLGHSLRPADEAFAATARTAVENGIVAAPQ